MSKKIYSMIGKKTGKKFANSGLYKISDIEFKENDICTFKNIFKRIKYGKCSVMEMPDRQLMAVWILKTGKFTVVETNWMKRCR